MYEYRRLKSINDKVYSGTLKISEEVPGACDRNWFKEYEYHYCNSPYCTPYAIRVELTDENNEDMGFVNVRVVPTTQVSSELSECYIKPPKALLNDRKCFIKCLDRYIEYGKEVECVPYIMPEGMLNVCAQASIWICLKIIESLSGGNVVSKDMPSLQNMATGVPSSDGYGLSLKSISRLLQLNRCGAFYFNSEITPLSDKELADTIYAYVESGLPVILRVDVSKLRWWDNAPPSYHAIVLIGHTMDDSGSIDGFVLHDESMFPYLTITRQDLLNAWKTAMEGDTIREAVMTVPPPVLVRFETANNIALGTIAELMRLNIPRATYQMRPMLLPFTVLKNVFSHFFKGNPLEQLINYGLMERGEIPDYMWVFFLHISGTNRLEEKADGIIIINAATNPQLILLSIPSITLMVSTDNKVYRLSFDEKQKPKKELLGEF